MQRSFATLMGLMLVFVVVCSGMACAPSERSRGVRVIIASSPESGAEVSIGGVVYGTTPVTIEGIEPGRTLFLRIQKEGYKRSDQTLIVPDEEEHRFVIQMEPLVGFVTIYSDPKMARVFLDEIQYLGDTPLINCPVPVGEHTYELRKDNFETVRQSITISEDFEYTHSHILKPQQGRLTVMSRPSAAEIWLNEELQPKKTPAQFTLPPGAYTVAVHTKGYISKEELVEIKANEDVSLELVMIEGDVPPGMVLIPAGEFICGVDAASPDERPRHKRTLEAFYIDKFEVTNKQFAAVFPTFTYETGADNVAVVGVSFKQAEAYAQAVGKRLPTEFEWEKAARGTDGREYPWGNTFNPECCNSKGITIGFSKRIGSYRCGASPFGCMDMAGNAYEWTSSWYQAYPGNKDVKVEYGQSFKVLRGGSFNSGPFELRCARRHYDLIDTVRSDYGFRCAKDIHPPKILTK